MNIRKLAACAVVVTGLGACQGPGGMDNSTLATIGGAAGGALLGSQVGEGRGQLAATAVGTLLGALAGQQIYNRMEQDDIRRAAAAEREAIAQNQPITWTSPDNGFEGTVQPVRTFENEAGQLCREYYHTVVIGGETETVRGTACRQDDGTWTLVG